MGFKSKYVNPMIIYFLIYVFGIALLTVGTTLARYSYTYLNHLFPAVFPMFSAVSEKEGYESYLKLINVVGAFIAVYFINYLAIRFDNSKLEHVISKTDGQYTIADGIKT